MFKKKQQDDQPVMQVPELTVEEMKREIASYLPQTVRAADGGDPEMQAAQKGRDLIVQEADFLQLETELSQAPTMFTGNGVLQRQRDPEFKKKSAKKAARKEAAAQQAEQDMQRAVAIQARVFSMQNQRGVLTMDSDIRTTRDILQNELGAYQKYPPRQDVTGYDRRANEAHYAKAKKVTRGMEAAARTDVQNLVNNLRHDIALEGSTALPDDLQQYIDSAYFRNKYGEQTIESKTLREKTEEEEVELAKLKQFVLAQRMIDTPSIIAMRIMLQDIRARKLALQQIKEEGNSLYIQRMAEILNREIADMTVKYQHKILMLRTFSGRPHSNRTQAQLNAIQQLGDLRRRMRAPGVTDEEKAALEQQGQAIYEHYTYEGPLERGDNADRAANGADMAE